MTRTEAAIQRRRKNLERARQLGVKLQWSSRFATFRRPIIASRAIRIK